MSESPSPQTAPPESPKATGKKRFFHFWRCFWLTFLVISLAYAWYSFYVPANDIAWADNVTTAQRQAAASGKPIIFYFTGKWCVPCRIMKRQVWADAEVTAVVNAGFIPVTVDVDNPENHPDDAEILDRYKIAGTPVTIITDPQGNVLHWREGRIGKADFLEFLKTTAAEDAE